MRSFKGQAFKWRRDFFFFLVAAGWSFARVPGVFNPDANDALSLKHAGYENTSMFTNKRDQLTDDGVKNHITAWNSVSHVLFYLLTLLWMFLFSKCKHAVWGFLVYLCIMSSEHSRVSVARKSNNLHWSAENRLVQPHGEKRFTKLKSCHVVYLKWMPNV